MNRKFNIKNITTASVLMAALTSGAALSADSDKSFMVRLSVDGKVSVPEWVTINYVYGNWGNVGAPHSCQNWVAPTDTIDWGESYQQSRLCKQTQNRTETPILFNPVLKTTKEGPVRVGSRDVSVTEFRPNIGTRDYIDGERIGTFGAWSRSSANYECDAWSPKPEDVDLYDSFTQSRTCLKDEVRIRDVFHVWASGKETFKRTETETRTVTDGEQQQATGARDYISGTRIANWSSWSNDGVPYNCETWSPSPSTVNLNQDFQQSRSCSQKQISDRDIFDVWRSGKETLNRNEDRSQVITVTQSQGSTGTKDFIKSTRNDSWSAWSNSGSPYGCTEWKADVSEVNYGESFTQERSCSQNQTRSRDVLNVWESGKETLNKVEDDSQVVTVTQNQSATGTKDYIVSQTAPSWSAWSNSGTAYACGSWSPSPSTVNLGQSFTQSRSCSQDQVRSRTIQDVWKSGKKTTNRVETDGQTVSVTQNQSATGTKNYIVGTAYGSWSGYSNSGSVYGCGSYTPSTSTVNLGQSFTQTRSCSQDQVRTRTTYDKWADGSETAKGTQTGSRTIDVSQSRVATGSKDYITGTSYGSWGSYSNTGSPYSCGSYSPAPGTIDYGQSFTQTRSCSQNQIRYRTIYNDWKSGARTSSGTDSSTRVVSTTQNRTSTGTKNVVVGGESTNGAWSWTASASCGSWSPSASTVNLDSSFTQTQSCSRPRARTITEYNVWSDGSKTVKNSYTENSTYTYSNSRTATGTKDYIVSTSYKEEYYVYGSWSCSSWSPSTGSVTQGQSFTQTRSCSRDVEVRYRRYEVWKSGKKVLVGQDHRRWETESKTESQSAVGTMQRRYYWERSSGMQCVSSPPLWNNYYGKECSSPGSVIYARQDTEKCYGGGYHAYKLVCQ